MKVCKREIFIGRGTGIQFDLHCIPPVDVHACSIYMVTIIIIVNILAAIYSILSKL
jgi:hypothetical protein